MSEVKMQDAEIIHAYPASKHNSKIGIYGVVGGGENSNRYILESKAANDLWCATTPLQAKITSLETELKVAETKVKKLEEQVSDAVYNWKCFEFSSWESVDEFVDGQMRVYKNEIDSITAASLKEAGE